jgi:hypothetical protein
MALLRLRRRSKLIAFLLIVSLIDFGCASFSRMQIISPRGNTYSYVYEMIEPVSSKSLQYQNPKFNMWFTIDQGAVNFDARNLSSSTMVILGGDASLGINGKFFPVRTSSTYYADSASLRLTTPVPAGGYVQDFFVPRNNIFYDGNKWVERDLLPTRDYNNPVRKQSIQKNIGNEIHLIVPIKIGNQLQEYTFKFRISTVKVVDPDSVIQHEPRLPPPPTPKRPPTKTEFWVSIGIVSSVTLAAILIVTREHPFPSGL